MEHAARRRRDVVRLVFACVMRLEAVLWGIEFGRGCTFYGRARLHRTVGSRIMIGDHCEFRSAPWSNWAGIDRACMLSTLQPNAVLSIGSNSGFSGTVIAAAESITICDRVLCGVNSAIMDTDWHGLLPEERAARGQSAPVLIEDDVWIGAGVLVLKGVTIGHGTVVAAGSVVTRSLPPLVIAGGNPARVIREL
jgi:acetyltransferase-like isoleucine patch superfamily enzyme